MSTSEPSLRPAAPALGEAAPAPGEAPPHRRRRRIALALLAAAALVLVVAATSYIPYMLRPSSVSFAVRNVEWLRENHMAWFVNGVEHVYYSWKAPQKGGAAPSALPDVGAALVPAHIRVQERTYLPADIKPVVHPSLPGEGVWRHATPRIRQSYPVLVTSFRPERDYPQLVASVMWVDTTRTQLALYPGRYQPPSAHPRGPMNVPASQRDRLVATFNGGFTYGDSRGGFAVNGRTYAPMVAKQGTLVGWRDGRVDVMAWEGGREVGRDVVLARQNLPLIVKDGRPSRQLDNSADWGATLGNAVRVWRSGVGVDGRGDLIYLAAPGQTAPSLARALVKAGAVRAIELDINPEWPCCIAYRWWGAHSPALVADTGMSSRYRYLTPDDRDFFAVYRRDPGKGFGVPFK